MPEQRKVTLKLLTLSCLSGLAVAACGQDLRSEAVESFHVRGQTIAISYLDNGCMTAESSLAIIETETQVIVDLRMQETGQWCTTEGYKVTSEALLMEPLGDRTVVDASTDTAIPKGVPTTNLPIAHPLGSQGRTTA